MVEPSTSTRSLLALDHLTKLHQLRGSDLRLRAVVLGGASGGATGRLVGLIVLALALRIRTAGVGARI